MLRRRKAYDRLRILSEAAQAQRRGRYRRAVALYRQVLAVEPENAELHRWLAPLLVRTRERAAACESYRRAAEGLRRQGFVERAIGVYREATARLRDADELWLGLAELELERRRPADALAVLRIGRRHLRGRGRRRRALRFVARAHEIAPEDFQTAFELAGLLASCGHRARSVALLARLAARHRGSELRRVRARQLRLSPGLRSAWRWLCSLPGSGGSAASAPRKRALRAR